MKTICDVLYTLSRNKISLSEKKINSNILCTYLLNEYNVFITIIMEGKIEGKRSRGRSRKYFFEEIFRQMGCTSY